MCYITTQHLEVDFFEDKAAQECSLLELQQGRAINMRKPRLGLIRGLRSLPRPHEHVGHRQHGRDGQDLVGAPARGGTGRRPQVSGFGHRVWSARRPGAPLPAIRARGAKRRSRVHGGGKASATHRPPQALQWRVKWH